MKRTRNEIFEASRLRRQHILDVLNAAGPMALAALAIATGFKKPDLSMDLHTMTRRREIAAVKKTGHRQIWKAIATTTFNIQFDPAEHTRRARETQARMRQEGEAAKATPGLRVVRLLDKKNTSRGGQCANINYGTIQCRMDETRVVI